MAFLKNEINEIIKPTTEQAGLESAPSAETEVTEGKRETAPEKETPATKTVESQTPLRRRPVVSRPSIPQVRDELTIKIEKVLEEGLGDSFQRLSPIAKQEFKIKGEETANKIRELMNSAKIKVKKIIRLILEWLKMLPGVNHFFLEQEAKIKTDKILQLKEQALKK